MATPQFSAPLRFTSSALRTLIVPLIIEQILAVTVGFADSLMVAGTGEAAVSGIMLVDQINMLIIQVLAALSTGGAVVTSQYLGRRDRDSACSAAKQLLYTVAFFSFIICAIALLFNRSILLGIFGDTDESVISYAQTYFLLSALSYPFIAIYNACAAIFRSMGNSRVSLFAATLMNLINVSGNAIFIFGFDMGVAGAGLASLLSRMIASIIILILLLNKNAAVNVHGLQKIRPNFSMQRKILRVGIPGGIENGLFQIGRLAVAGVVSGLGVSAMAANSVIGSILGFSGVPGIAVGFAMLTVVGQCVGAKDYAQARYYIKKMLLLAYGGMALLNILIMFFAPFLVGIYNFSAQTSDLAVQVLQVMTVMTIFFWTPSFTAPNALRAAGDVKYTLTISMISMWIFRVALCYLLVYMFDLGLMGVWIPMAADWVVRSIFFVPRLLGKKWQTKRVID